MRTCLRLLVLTVLIAVPWRTGAAADVESLLELIRGAEVGGAGNDRVAVAWKELAKSNPEQLPKILGSLKGANPLAANWLRNAVDVIAARGASTGNLPKEKLEAFVRTTSHDPRARRLAYEWLAKVEKTAADRLIPTMLNDPSVEFRRDAVARLLATANDLRDQKKAEKATSVYRRALGGARDEDQIKAIAGSLRKLGHKVDLPRHFGFLMQWQVIGPFDNTGRKGFSTVYPPEKELKATAKYPGKNGVIGWKPFTTKHDYGMVDVNQPYGKLKEVVGYAWAQFESESAREVEIRLGCKNAWKIWLNGRLVFGRPEYHRGMRLDQYQLPVKLVKGRNDILVKLCQNEQTESWTVEWQFQLRICDKTGTAILASNRD